MGKYKSNKNMMAHEEDTFEQGNGIPVEGNNGNELGVLPGNPESMEDYLATTDKYNAGEDLLAEHLPVRHRNRNALKSEEGNRGKERKEQSNKSKNQSTADEELPNIQPEQLPGVLTKDRFTELANFKDGITISLYFATSKVGVVADDRFDAIAFKSVLNTVEQMLKEKGQESELVQRLLKPGYELIRDDAFWADLSEGLAVFIAEGFFKFIKMPVTTERKIVLESTFYVTPLISILTSNEYFYLLVMSKHTVKLFRADAWGMQHVPVDLPQGIEQVKRLSDGDATTFRRGESGRRANPAAMTGQSHGAGGGNPDGKENLATYFEAVDDILWDEVFNKENAPLVLAGVEYEIPIYRSVCDYHNVWEQALTGSRERQETAALYKDAKELMQPFFLQNTTKALDQYGNKSATALTSSVVEDVIPATYYGRVSHLFVCKGYQVWGTFDEMTSEIQLHESQADDSEDLVDNAVVKTLSTGGEVFLLEKDQMPADSAVAAIMRY